jgi:hypothetical protein
MSNTNYYVPDIDDIMVGFRYEYKTQVSGETHIFGRPKIKPIPYEFDEWRKAEVTTCINEGKSVEWFERMIEKGNIRTCEEFNGQKKWQERNDKK